MFGIIGHAGCGEEGRLAGLFALDADEARGPAQAGSVEDWATESFGGPGGLPGPEDGAEDQVGDQVGR